MVEAEPIHHREPACFRDRFAYGLVKFMRLFADPFFAKRYGHGAVVLETVMVAQTRCPGAQPLAHIFAGPCVALATRSSSEHSSPIQGESVNFG
jgi:hypothetical protein